MVLAIRRARNACWLKLGMRDGCRARGMLTVSPGFRPGLLVMRGMPFDTKPPAEAGGLRTGNAAWR